MRVAARSANLSKQSKQYFSFPRAREWCLVSFTPINDWIGWRGWRVPGLGSNQRNRADQLANLGWQVPGEVGKRWPVAFLATMADTASE